MRDIHQAFDRLIAAKSVKVHQVPNCGAIRMMEQQGGHFIVQLQGAAESFGFLVHQGHSSGEGFVAPGNGGPHFKSVCGCCTPSTHLGVEWIGFYGQMVGAVCKENGIHNLVFRRPNTYAERFVRFGVRTWEVKGWEKDIRKEWEKNKNNIPFREAFEAVD